LEAEAKKAIDAYNANDLLRTAPDKVVEFIVGQVRPDVPILDESKIETASSETTIPAESLRWRVDLVLRTSSSVQGSRILDLIHFGGQCF
ncbi:MAG: hypothetical protein V2A66_06085, partial [Pseudomonadota bacterium]